MPKPKNKMPLRPRRQPTDREKPMVLLSQTPLAKPLVEKLAGHGLREVAQLLSYAATPSGQAGLSRFLDIALPELNRLIAGLRAEYPREAKAAEHPAPAHAPRYGLIPGDG